MKRGSRFLVCLLACLLLFAGCAKEAKLSEGEAAALKKAGDWFAWSLQTLEEEYTIAYDTELRIDLEGKDCYLFRAEDAQGKTIVYAAVAEDASDIWQRFTPEAEWQKISPETWAEVELWTEGVG